MYTGVSRRVLRVQAGAHRVPGRHLKHTTTDTCTELVCMRYVYSIYCMCDVRMVCIRCAYL